MNKFPHLIILVISLNLSAQKNKALKDSNTEFGYLSDTTIGGNLTVNGLSNLNGQVSVGSDLSVDGSVAAGFQNVASGLESAAFGQNSSATGRASAAMGYHTIASDYASLVIGRYNLLNSTLTSNQDAFNLLNAAFVIGNGNENERSDALTVLFDGTTTIAGDLRVNSDARLKANIISLGSTLAKLLQIDGKTYSMKKDEKKKQKIGLLAQDIEKVFPELVSESNGIKSVNYQGLVPVLINALKEQDSKMKEQETRIERLEKLLLD
jgi:hypothetical protein